jgi:predicted DCC family thiol-disulfide oxidoreductase YuxK
MARWARRHGVAAVPSQQAGVLQRYGATREEADRAALVVGATGGRLEGAAALNRVLDEIGGSWRVVAQAYRLRPIASLEEAVYGWFARRRSLFHRLGVTPECDEPGASCE